MVTDSANIMQGDQYGIPFTLTVEGEEADLTFIEKIEFCVGNIAKYFPSKDVSYKPDTNEFIVRLTQADTMKLHGKEKCSVRIKYTSGDVIGAVAGYFEIERSESRAVL